MSTRYTVTFWAIWKWRRIARRTRAMVVGILAGLITPLPFLLALGFNNSWLWHILVNLLLLFLVAFFVTTIYLRLTRRLGAVERS